MLERLTFEAGKMAYNVADAAEHLSRYLAVRQICRGKRVLDVACGEGYGSRMMRDWGAASVLGVDISAEAIMSARTMFGGQDISFETLDALQLDAYEEYLERFDLVVSFETIEHVTDPRRLLEVLSKLCAADGVIAVSCPNGAIEESEGHNPFHHHRFTLDAFRSLSEEVLGQASRWLIGVPVLGFAAFPVNLPQLRNASESADSIMAGSDLSLATHALPSNLHCSVDASNCSYYLGIWRSDSECPAVIAPQSWKCLAAPWKSIDFMREHIAMLEASVRQERRSARLDARSAKDELIRLSSSNASLQEALQKRDAELLLAKEALQRQADDLSRNRDESRRLIDELNQTREESQRQASELLETKRSRIYRLALSYYSLYARPGFLGATMRAARKIAGRTLRAARRR